MTAAVVDLRSRRVRRRNVTGSERCRSCANSALIVVATEQRPVLRKVRCGRDQATRMMASSETYTEDLYGPCPHCERGYRLEFGIGKKSTGEEYQNPNGGPWGTEGFWRGRDLPEEIAEK